VIAALSALQKLASNPLPGFVVTAVRMVLKGGFECDFNICKCSII
jgi:hypothetical protein